MEDISKTRIYRATNHVRILVWDELIPLETFAWHDEEDLGGWITLEEISSKLKDVGVIHVWEEGPMYGTIYQCGNYNPGEWLKHGTTKGYA
jgi:hypothetical protein